MKESFESLQLKRQKLKTGTIKFSFKTFYYNGILWFQWFEMEYSSQPMANKGAQEAKRILDTLSLKKDLQTLILILLTLFFLLSYINYCIDSYILDVIAPKVPDSSQKNLITNTFDLILPKMVFLNNTFKLICDSQIRLSDFIEII